MTEERNDQIGVNGEAERPRPKGALAKGLHDAQQRAKAVEKDKANAHHGYRYASAEALIAEAKEALAGSGLAPVPLEITVRPSAKVANERELFRRILLVHESGESLPVELTWPIVVEKGRPLDKATAIADTMSLAYWLRDLLLLPRVEPGTDLAGLKDQGGEAASASAPPPEDKTVQTTEQLATTEQLDHMAKLRDELFTASKELDPRGRWGRYLLPYRVDSARHLTLTQAAELIAKLRSQLDLGAMEQALAGKGA